MEKIGITVVGAGVVGVAIAAELSRADEDILVIEQHASFGRETSSRNSEVIHAGIYYPKNSLKATLCVEGHRLLYEFCVQNHVPHRRIGKLIVARDAKEIADLEGIMQKGIANGVEGLRWMTKAETLALEPYIRAEAAIHSPHTGIIDSHALMKTLVYQFTSRGGMIIYNTQVVGIDRSPEGFRVSVQEKSGEKTQIATRVLINAAGLSSDKVAVMAGIDRPDYALKFCKGEYFRVRPGKSKFISRLVYPVPTEDHAGLGVHATLDLAGQMRLGPDTEYVSQIDYTVDPVKQKDFFKSVVTFLPFIEFDDLSPDTSGIRPKLQGPDEPVKDFLIKNEAENGLPGLINLIGIESPGLTACIAIARCVNGLLLHP